jgi:rhodanese-related sulfurtransferase
LPSLWRTAKLFVMTSPVTYVPAADSAVALSHFDERLRFETDPDDVATALALGVADFVILDARSPEAYGAGHLPGAHNLPRPYSLEDLGRMGDQLIVVYCWGPGCNGAVKAAREIAALGFPVKEMLGGFEYWAREGHPVEGRDVAVISTGEDHQGLVKVHDAVSCMC